MPRFEALAYDLPHFDAITHVVILVSAALIFQSGLLRSDISLIFFVKRKEYIDLYLLNRPKRSSFRNLLLKFTLDEAFIFFSMVRHCL